MSIPSIWRFMIDYRKRESSICSRSLSDRQAPSVLVETLARSRYCNQGSQADGERRQPAHESGIQAEDLAAFLDGSGNEEKYDAQHDADHGARAGSGGAQRAEYEGQSQERHDDHGEKSRDPRPVADFVRRGIQAIAAQMIDIGGQAPQR